MWGGGGAEGRRGAQRGAHILPHGNGRRWLASVVAVVATCSYLIAMRTVGIKVLKNKLSEYVRMAEAGEVVLVTDRDRVVAELRPPMERAPLAADALLADLVRRGVLTPPLMVREGPPPRVPVAPTRQLLDELAADRGDR